MESIGFMHSLSADESKMPRKGENKCYDVIMKYRQYILRSSEQYLLSIQDLIENNGVLVDQVDDADQ